MDVNVNEKLHNLKTFLSACSDLQYYISQSFHKGKVGCGHIFMGYSYISCQSQTMEILVLALAIVYLYRSILKVFNFYIKAMKNWSKLYENDIVVRQLVEIFEKFCIQGNIKLHSHTSLSSFYVFVIGQMVVRQLLSVF